MSSFTDRVQLPLTPDFLGGQNGRFLPENGSILELQFLRDALKPKVGDDDDFVELFIPERVVIREEMETAIKELLNNGNNTTTVFSGSPGIGKSILMFLVVLYRVVARNEKAIYQRRTEDSIELVSELAMEYDSAASVVDIRFTREKSRSVDLAKENDELRKSFEPAVRWASGSIVDAVDGPKSADLSRFSKLTYGCTSGAGIHIKNHMVATTFNVVMGGWKKVDLEASIIAELGLDPEEKDDKSEVYFDTEKFDAVYFVNGGRIRNFRNSYQGDLDTSFADQVVNRISKQQAMLSLSHSDCRSTDQHVDSLRTMFRAEGGSTDSVVLHVDSGYMLRKLEAEISGEEMFNSYKKAERERNKGAHANYFEELLHWCFRREDISPSIVESVHASGSGSEGVKELTKKNQYWIPSVPNFVNIDSAVVGVDDKVWCYQFTTGSSHTYKKRRTKSQFLDKIAVLDSTNEVIIVFVYPKGTDFAVPDTGGEVDCDEFAVDCTSLATVLASVKKMADKIAVSTTSS